MALTITAKDANGDGTGVNLAAYLAAFAKTYSDDTGTGDFSGKVTGSYADENNPYHAATYVTTDNEDGGGTSVLFNGGTGGFSYSGPYEYNGAAHVVYGQLASIVFGTDTLVTPIGGTASEYSNSADITISGFGSSYVTTSQDGQVLGDILKADTNGIGSLYALLKANAIIFVGSTGADTFTGYGYADTIKGGAGNDVLNGGAGNDTVDGGAGNDKLNGGIGNDVLTGGAGDDVITDSSGNDKIDGGTGNDTINGGAGNDVVTGGTGNDVITDSAGNDKISGGLGNDTINAGAGNDVVTGDDGDDKLNGGAGNDIMTGGASVDSLVGGDGNDKLNGGAGNDKLSGGTGDDRVDGDLGNDILAGGAGADTFFFAKGDGIDRITDFEAGKLGKDVIEFAKGLFDSYADVLDHAKDTTAGIVITYDGGRVTLTGVEVHDLIASDFHLL